MAKKVMTAANKTTQPKPSVLPLADKEPWRENLRKASLRVGFALQLSKAMLEFLCAVSDGVNWDRSLFPCGAGVDNWLASSRSLIKRGLIEDIPASERKKLTDDEIYLQSHERSTHRLTPAGKLVVELLKLAGVFAEADAAINKKAGNGKPT